MVFSATPCLWVSGWSNTSIFCIISTVATVAVTKQCRANNIGASTGGNGRHPPTHLLFRYHEYDSRFGVCINVRIHASIWTWIRGEHVTEIIKRKSNLISKHGRAKLTERKTEKHRRGVLYLYSFLALWLICFHCRLLPSLLLNLNWRCHHTLSLQDLLEFGPLVLRGRTSFQMYVKFLDPPLISFSWPLNQTSSPFQIYMI